jgi:DNA-binding transcriptional LysR family regulator
MVGLVAAGFGVAILPGEAQCIRQDGVLYEDIVDSNAVSSMYFAFRDRDPNPHLKLLLDCLQDTIASR